MKCSCGSSWECVCPTCHQWAPSDKWISVKDRKPDLIERGPRLNPSSDKVLVTDGREVQVGIRWICGKDEYFLPDYRENFDKVTHWMPLPEPPK